VRYSRDVRAGATSRVSQSVGSGGHAQALEAERIGRRPQHRVALARNALHRPHGLSRGVGGEVDHGGLAHARRILQAAGFERPYAPLEAVQHRAAGRHRDGRVGRLRHGEGVKQGGLAHPLKPPPPVARHHQSEGGAQRNHVRRRPRAHHHLLGIGESTVGPRRPRDEHDRPNPLHKSSRNPRRSHAPGASRVGR
jgi:hypothetical protein